MKLFCVFTINEYGESGNELMPPITSTHRFAVEADVDETSQEFKMRMARIGVDVRKNLDEIPPKPYSIKPSCDWDVIEGHNLGEMAILIENLRR